MLRQSSWRQWLPRFAVGVLLVLLAGCGDDGSNPSGPPAISLDTSSVTFSAVSGGATPSSQQVAASYNGAAQVVVGIPPGSPDFRSWLDIVPLGSPTDNPLVFDLRIIDTALIPDTYTAVVRFVALDGGGGVLGYADLAITYVVVP